MLRGDGFVNAQDASGLTSQQVEQLRAQYGYNEVPPKRVSYILMFLKKFWGLSPVILELTIIASLALQNWILAGVTGALLLLNGVIGFWQEVKAAKAIKHLEEVVRIDAKVRRDNQWVVIPSRELVPSDVIELRQGDFVPADVIVLDEIHVDQSALTGESDILVKPRGSDVFSGSIVRQGECEALVKVVGEKSRFADSLKLVAVSRPKMHIEQLLFRVVVIQMCAALGLLLIAIIVLLARPETRGMFVQDIPLFLSIIVASVPVALPAMFTLTMALGSVELSSHGLLVTRLSATEDAASMSVLCTDKTGTLTSNKLTLTGLAALSENVTEKQLLATSLFASKPESMDAIDLAVADKSSSIRNEIMDGVVEVTDFTPFSAATRQTSARVVMNNGASFIAVKGAVNTVLTECMVAPESDLGHVVAAKVADASQNGFRVLAVAQCDANHENWHFQGLLFFSDPPRASSAGIVAEVKDLGVRVIMITGDNPSVARHIAHEVGLDGSVVKFADIHNEPPALDVCGLAEVFPEEKHAMVKLLQSDGYVVGMTGDGVNDAPALKQAEVGVAMSNATDVAKAAASVVSFNEGLEGVPRMIGVGRQIHSRLRTWILNKITKTIQQGFITIFFLIRQAWVVHPINVIVLLFLIDFATLVLSTDRASIAKKPVKWVIWQLLLVSGVIGAMCLGESIGLFFLFLYVFDFQSDLLRQYTLSFLILFCFALLNVFSLRERDHFWKSPPSLWLIGVSLVDTMVVLICVCVGADVFYLKQIIWWQAFLVFGWCAAFIFIVNDFVKVLLFRAIDK